MSDVLALLPPWNWQQLVLADRITAVGGWPVQQQQAQQQRENHNKRKHPDEQPRSAAQSTEAGGQATGPRGKSLDSQKQQLEQQQERKKQRHHVDPAKPAAQPAETSAATDRGNSIEELTSSRSLSGDANHETINLSQAEAVAVPPAAGAASTAQPFVKSFAEAVIAGTAAATAGISAAACATDTNGSATAATGTCVVHRSYAPPVVGYIAAEGKEELHTPSFPARPGKQTCAWYLKTGHCKYGPECVFDHPPEYAVQLTAQGFPFRSGQPMCTFYKTTQQCKFGPSCKFHHPKIIPIYAGSPIKQQNCFS